MQEYTPLQYPVIPKPVALTPSDGVFKIASSTRILEIFLPKIKMMGMNYRPIS